MPSCPVVAAAPKLDYDEKLKQPQRAKAGSMFILQVNVSGFPTPSVNWSLNGKTVSAREITIATTPDCSTLTVKGSSAKVAGTYSITAQNAVGTDTAEFNIQVIGGRFYSDVLHDERQIYDGVIVEVNSTISSHSIDFIAVNVFRVRCFTR